MIFSLKGYFTLIISDGSVLGIGSMGLRYQVYGTYPLRGQYSQVILLSWVGIVAMTKA
jgi:hypothetical protein